MSEIDIALLGDGRCRIRHAESGSEILSSKSPELGGVGGAFSSTDLLAAALGSCIATNLEPVAQRHDVRLDQLSVRVEKKLTASPKRIASLTVRIQVEAPLPEDVALRLRRAADHCLVHRSLAKEIDLRIELSSAPE